VRHRGAVLERLGVPIASLVAPAAVLGAALGFGAQQVVRDLIAGTFIVLERQYGYGDVVHISAVGFTEGATGTIEEVAPRTTRLRTLNEERAPCRGLRGVGVGVVDAYRNFRTGRRSVVPDAYRASRQRHDLGSR
jgi:hypothetical protein